VSDPLGPARGVVFGILLGIWLWLIVILVGWWLAV
jgi:hypothetical protein